MANDPRRAAAGFTLIELMVVIALVAIVSRVAMTNIGALIPAAILKAETRKLMVQLDFLRSEARLQGKSYGLEVDLDHDRWRAILPPEDLLVTNLDEQGKTLPLQWMPIDPRADLAAYAIPGEELVRNGTFVVVFDENGFTADQSVVFTLREDPELVWTVNLRGLTGSSDVVAKRDGNPSFLEVTTEAAF
jgi:prepilin-type N-terminal cleavage/methylation domain-containing protein